MFRNVYPDIDIDIIDKNIHKIYVYHLYLFLYVVYPCMHRLIAKIYHEFGQGQGGVYRRNVIKL